MEKYFPSLIKIKSNCIWTAPQLPKITNLELGMNKVLIKELVLCFFNVGEIFKTRIFLSMYGPSVPLLCTFPFCCCLDCCWSSLRYCQAQFWRRFLIYLFHSQCWQLAAFQIKAEILLWSLDSRSWRIKHLMLRGLFRSPTELEHHANYLHK